MALPKCLGVGLSGGQSCSMYRQQGFGGGEKSKGLYACEQNVSLRQLAQAWQILSHDFFEVNHTEHCVKGLKATQDTSVVAISSMAHRTPLVYNTLLTVKYAIEEATDRIVEVALK